MYAILPRDGKLLLTYQGGIHDEVQLPGGGIDPGESPIAALHREVFEETGWRISTPRFYVRFKRCAYMPEYDQWAEKICHIYIAHPVRPLDDPPEAEHAAIWLDPLDAVDILGNSGDRAAVAQFMRA